MGEEEHIRSIKGKVVQGKSWSSAQRVNTRRGSHWCYLTSWSSSVLLENQAAIEARRFSAAAAVKMLWSVRQLWKHTESESFLCSIVLHIMSGEAFITLKWLLLLPIRGRRLAKRYAGIANPIRFGTRSVSMVLSSSQYEPCANICPWCKFSPEAKLNHSKALTFCYFPTLEKEQILDTKFNPTCQMMVMWDNAVLYLFPVLEQQLQEVRRIICYFVELPNRSPLALQESRPMLMSSCYNT